MPPPNEDFCGRLGLLTIALLRKGLELAGWG